MKIDINYLRDIDYPPTKTQMDYAERILKEFEDNVEDCQFLGNLSIVIYLRKNPEEYVEVWIWKTKISTNLNRKDKEKIHNEFNYIDFAMSYLKELLNEK